MAVENRQCFQSRNAQAQVPQSQWSAGWCLSAETAEALYATGSRLKLIVSPDAPSSAARAGAGAREEAGSQLVFSGAGL